MDAKALAQLLRARRIVIIAAGLCGILIGVILLLLIPRTYSATVVVAPTTGETPLNVSGIYGGLGGLATLAGVSTNNDQRRFEALAFLEGRSFTTRFIETNDLLPLVFSDRWDAAKSHWRLAEGKDPPTSEDAWEVFDREIRSIRQDKFSGLITLSIHWTDPVIAANWANGIVKSANDELRAKAIADANKRMQFLNSELARTEVLELQRAIRSLMETELKTIMLANVHDDFAFKIIDAAMPTSPQKYVSPRPVAVVLGMTIGAILLAIALCVLAEMFRQTPLNQPTAEGRPDRTVR